MRVFDPQHQIYLAGPFFNGPQHEAAIRIANLCAHYGVKYFSPLLAGGGPIKSPEHAAEVYSRNCRELNVSAVVLAQLEWLMEPDRQVRVVDPIGPTSGIFASPPLNIPDSGTVWELGYAACLKEIRLGGYKEELEKNPRKCECRIGSFTCGFCMEAAAVRDGHTTAEKQRRDKELQAVRPLVVAYTTAPQGTLNLMLARSCDAYLDGWPAVNDFLATGELPADARTFKGREQ